MRFIFIPTILFLLTHPATASLKKCKSELKKADRICQSAYFCKRDYLKVSGYDIIDTGSDVICRGDKSISNPTDKNEQKSRKIKKRVLKF